MITITVAYATPEKQVEIPLEVNEPCTIAQAIALSKITLQFPEINLSVASVGIFSKLASLDTMLKADDRVEIYRPLIIDPKEARRKRA